MKGLVFFRADSVAEGIAKNGIHFSAAQIGRRRRL